MGLRLLEGQSAPGLIEPAGNGALRRKAAPHRGLFFTVFVLTTIVFAVSPVITNYDSFATFPTAVSIVNRHTLFLDAYRHVGVLAKSYTVGHARSHLVTSYPWAVGLFAVPAVIVVDLVHVLGGPSADSIVAGQSQVQNLVQLFSASIITGLACATLALLAYRRLRGSAETRSNWAVLCGLAFGFATSAWSTASRALWQHGPSILFLAMALLALDPLFPRDTQDQRRRIDSIRPPLLAGVCVAGAVTMRPTNAVALGLVTILVFWKAQRRSAAFYAIGIVVVFLPWTLITYHYYGSLLQPYDQASKLGLPSTFFESVAAQLISPSRGLFIFSPIVLVGIAGLVIANRRRLVTLLEALSAAAVPCYLVAIALFPVWWAGTSFGPRFMTEALPFLFVLAIPFVEWIMAWRAEKSMARPLLYKCAIVGSVVALTFSVFVNAQGGLLRSSVCWNLKTPTAASVDNDPARVWSLDDPQFVFGLEAIRTEGLHAAITRCPAGTPLP
jgi:hypothetical protein